jgi:hypothetical protein
MVLAGVLCVVVESAGRARGGHGSSKMDKSMIDGREFKLEMCSLPCRK